MNLACGNNHVFDADKNPNRCPHCGLPPIKFDIDKRDDSDEKVVGWLVCIKGQQKGKDFKIMQEINLIGRSTSMDMQIKGDEGVLDENHAIISYDVDLRDCFLIPGEKGTVYHQGKEIQHAKILNDYDEVRIGNSRFIFRSLCNREYFDWDE